MRYMSSSSFYQLVLTELHIYLICYHIAHKVQIDICSLKKLRFHLRMVNPNKICSQPYFKDMTRIPKLDCFFSTIEARRF